jgi:outer membrane protein, multidrug efflux system
MSLPDEWTASIQADNSARVTGSQRWWQKFDDPTLNRLIQISRKANPNIRIARARITESWYQRAVLASAWAPHGEFDSRVEEGIGSFDRSGVKWDLGQGRNELAQFNVGWEIDLFGKTARQVEAATADYQTQIEGWRDATVFINSEVALHYIAYRTLEKRIANAQEAQKNYETIQRMVSVLNEEGISSRLDLKEANGRLQTAKAEVPPLQEENAVIRNRLAALLATRPGDMESYLANNREIPTPPSSISTGFPAQLLRSRPDVRRAERKIAVQTALVGVATAQLYPELSISGAITYENLRASSLTRTLGLGPNLRWRIFNCCQDRKRIKEFEAKVTQAIIEYEKTVIQAVADVEIAMTRIQHTRRRQAMLENAAEDLKEAAKLMKEAYQLGTVDLRRLLNAQQDYITVQDESIANRGRLAAHSVRLFKALGGGELPLPSRARTLQPARQFKAN